MTIHRIGFQPEFLSMLWQAVIIVSQKFGSHNHDAHISGSFGSHVANFASLVPRKWAI